MNLSELVHKRLSVDRNIASCLAEYGGTPAIFNTDFPNDQDEGWEGRTQYPRISYQFNMQVDMDRASAGTLRVSVYSFQNPIICERLEVFVRDALKDVLMKADDHAPVCVSWARTDPFLLEGNEIICKDIEFDVLEYPSQETTDPDPIMALSAYIKEVVPDSIVLGIDEVGEFTNPADAPIIFCRLESLQLDLTGHSRQQVTWFNCQIAVHLLCPDPSLRLKLAAGLSQRLALDDEIIMLDDSPMTLRGITMNNRADYLRGGQLTINAHYGCLNDSFAMPIVRHVNITVKEAQ